MLPLLLLHPLKKEQKEEEGDRFSEAVFKRTRRYLKTRAQANGYYSPLL